MQKKEAESKRRGGANTGPESPPLCRSYVIRLSKYWVYANNSFLARIIYNFGVQKYMK